MKVEDRRPGDPGPPPKKSFAKGKAASSVDVAIQKIWKTREGCILPALCDPQEKGAYLLYQTWMDRIHWRQISPLPQL